VKEESDFLQIRIFMQCEGALVDKVDNVFVPHRNRLLSHVGAGFKYPLQHLMRDAPQEDRILLTVDHRNGDIFVCIPQNLN